MSPNCTWRCTVLAVLLPPLQSAHICCKVRKPTFHYVLQTGAYNRLLRGKCGTWTNLDTESEGTVGGVMQTTRRLQVKAACSSIVFLTLPTSSADVLLPHFWFVRQNRNSTSRIAFLRSRGPGHTCPMVTPKLGPCLYDLRPTTPPRHSFEKRLQRCQALYMNIQKRLAMNVDEQREAYRRRQQKHECLASSALVLLC